MYLLFHLLEVSVQQTPQDWLSIFMELKYMNFTKYYFYLFRLLSHKNATALIYK